MQNRFEIFTVLISKINRNVRRLKAEVMSDFNLKVPHVSCIYYLFRKGELTAKELCDICDEDKSGISRSIDFLEKEGYVVCSDGAGKRYKSPLRLTEKGRAIGQVICDRISEVLSRTGKELSEDQRQSFYDNLAIISEDLERLDCQMQSITTRGER